MRSAERNTPANMLGRVMLVLRTLGDGEGRLSLSDLSRQTGLAKSTLSRITAQMEHEGLLETGSDGRFQLGLRLFELGQRVPRQQMLREVAAPFLRDLTVRLSSTTHLAILDGPDVVYVLIRRGPKPIANLPSREGGRMPAHATAVGKALLAFSTPERVRRRLNAGLPRVTPYTISSPARLQQELAVVRQQGVAYDRQEAALGLACVAAPVFAPDGAVIAAVSASIASRYERLRILAGDVQSTATALGRHLNRPG